MGIPRIRGFTRGRANARVWAYPGAHRGHVESFQDSEILLIRVLLRFRLCAGKGGKEAGGQRAPDVGRGDRVPRERFSRIVVVARASYAPVTAVAFAFALPLAGARPRFLNTSVTFVAAGIVSLSRAWRSGAAS